MEAPWMGWMLKLVGGTETDKKFSDFMSKFWHLVGLSFTTISGRTHAWCALTVNAALHETGYSGSGSAAAKSFEHYGVPCEYKYGAIIPIRHAGGGEHVTCFHHWVDEKNKIAACLGGNQHDGLNVSHFNLSGNAHGHDECVSGPRWPVK